MAFIRVLSTSSIFALISILSMAFKELIMNKEDNFIVDYTILISSILYFAFMIASIIIYFIQIKDERARKYQSLFYILVVCIPVFIILLNVYI